MAEVNAGRDEHANELFQEVISEIAVSHGKSSAQVILRWNLQKGVIVIPGSCRHHRSG